MTTTFHRCAAGAATLVLAAGALAGCSSVEDRIAEAVVGEVLEQAVGDGTKVEVDEGEESITITSEDGDTSITQSLQLPDSWPASLPIPSDYTLVQATEFEGPDNVTTTAILETGASYDDVVAELLAGLESSPWSVSREPIEADLGDTTTWQVAMTLDDVSGTVAVRGTPDEVTVMYHLDTPTT